MAMLPFPMPMAAAPASTGQSGFVILTTPGPGSWTVPSGFDPANNVIEIIAGGGKGADHPSGSGSKGGGGGQYAKLVNFNPGIATSISYQIGIAGGSVGSSAAPGAADSWFDSASATMYAQGGTSGVGSGAGPPGGSAPAVGSSTVANGGGGGNGGGLVSQGSGAGGGAGGPHGAGANGASNDGGTSAKSGGAGDAGNAPGGVVSGSVSAQPGGTENYWGPGIGPGGGGSSCSTAIAGDGGVGGNYGGGGGGAGSSGFGGAAGQGILVIRWGDYASNVTAAPTFLAPPVITSSAGTFCAVGDTLSATPGTSVGYVSSTSFQWYADGAAISGATGLSYTLTSAELGKVITITETISNAAGSASASASAIRFGPVVNPAFQIDQRITTASDNRVTVAGDFRVSSTRIA